MTPAQEAFLDRVKERLENPPVLVLTPEQIAQREAWLALPPADRSIQRFNTARPSLLRSSIHTIQENWSNIWENPDATPAEMLLAMGTNATQIFQTSADYTLVIYNIGQSMTPVVNLDPKYLSAKYPYTAHEDGSITLNPTDPPLVQLKTPRKSKQQTKGE